MYMSQGNIPFSKMGWNNTVNVLLIMPNIQYE